MLQQKCVNCVQRLQQAPCLRWLGKNSGRMPRSPTVGVAQIPWEASLTPNDSPVGSLRPESHLCWRQFGILVSGHTKLGPRQAVPAMLPRKKGGTGPS